MHHIITGGNPDVNCPNIHMRCSKQGCGDVHRYAGRKRGMDAVTSKRMVDEAKPVQESTWEEDALTKVRLSCWKCSRTDAEAVGSVGDCRR